MLSCALFACVAIFAKICLVVRISFAGAIAPPKARRSSRRMAAESRPHSKLQGISSKDGNWQWTKSGHGGIAMPIADSQSEKRHPGPLNSRPITTRQHLEQWSSCCTISIRGGKPLIIQNQPSPFLRVQAFCSYFFSGHPMLIP